MNHVSISRNAAPYGELAEVHNDGEEPWTSAEFAARAADAEALLCFMTDTVDAALLDRCSAKTDSNSFESRNGVHCDKHHFLRISFCMNNQIVCTAMNIIVYEGDADYVTSFS